MNDLAHLETLAALLDGALSDEERVRVLARLVKSEYEYEDVLETAAMLDEMDAGSREKSERRGHLIYVS